MKPTTVIGLVVSTVLVSSVAHAATPIDHVWLSPDTTLDVQGTLVADEDVAKDNLDTSPGLASLGALPGAAAVSAYHQLENGDQVFALETVTDLGALVAGPADIVQRAANGDYSRPFEGGVEGVPAGVGIDALTMDGADYLMSFDATVSLSSTVFSDEDLVRWNGSAFSLFSGMPTVPTSMDLDGAHLRDNGNLLVSYDITGTVDGVLIHDEDVLEIVLSTSSSKFLSGSDRDSDWESAGLEALFVTFGIFSDGFESGSTSEW